MRGQRVALLVDFDDTVAELLLKFGGDGWKGFREAFRQGTLNLRRH